jgi:hypothetical protein
VIGVVVSKHAPISQYHHSAIEALANNSSGVTYAATNENGDVKRFVESQLVAELLIHMRNLTQVMIGEAIAVEELMVSMLSWLIRQETFLAESLMTCLLS